MTVEQSISETDRDYALLGLQTGLFGIVLACTFITFNGIAAACALLCSGYISASWGGFSSKTETGRVACRLGAISFAFGLVIGLFSLWMIIREIDSQIRRT